MSQLIKQLEHIGINADRRYDASALEELKISDLPKETVYGVMGVPEGNFRGALGVPEGDFTSHPLN